MGTRRGGATISLSLMLPAFAVVCALVGCASLQTAEPIAPAFTGLQSLSSTAADDPPRLLIIHGITTQKVDYADQLVESLARRLSLTYDEKDFVDRRFSVPGAISFDGADAEIVLRTYRLYAGSQERLRVTAVDWSPLTASIKRHQFAQDDSVRRALVNGEIKTQVVNDGIGDAALYLGDYRQVMRRGVMIGLCAFLEGEMAGDACRPTGRSHSDVALISMSLGSYMLFDAIEQLNQSRDASAAGAPLFERLRQFYMFADQLPLLELADLKPAAGPGAKLVALSAGGSHFSQFLDRVRLARRTSAGRRRRPEISPGGAPIGAAPSAPLQIVAFSDPNDLLTYEIEKADYLADGADPKAFQTTNVTPTVATPWFGVFADPVLAHTGYASNGAVLDLVVCGSVGCGK